MAYSSRRPNANTIAIARQSAATTENTTDGDFSAIPVTFDFTEDQEKEDMQSAAGQFGASEAPSMGGKFGSFALSDRIAALKSGYDYTADAVDGSGVPSPLIALLADAIGSAGAASASSAAEWARAYGTSRSAYINGDVGSGSTTTVIAVADHTQYTVGQLAAWTTNASSQVMCGWVVSTASGAPDTVTIAFPAIAAPASGDDRIPTATAYLSSNSPSPLTIRRLGDNAAFKWSYIGAIAEELTLDLSARKVPTWELKGQFLDYERYGGGGGLIAPSAFQRARPYIGTRGGDLYVDGSSVCGYEDLQIMVKWDLTSTSCHGSSEGVSEFTRQLAAESPITIKMTVRLNSSDTISGQRDQWQNARDNGTDFEIGGYVGQTAGEIFAWFMPAVHIVELTKTEIDGVDAYEITMRPSGYSADTGSTAPADTLLRLGWA